MRLEADMFLAQIALRPNILAPKWLRPDVSRLNVGDRQ